MHASPPFQMIVRRFGVWRFTSTVLVLMAASAVGAWVHRAADPFAIWSVIAVGGLVLSSAAILSHAWRLLPTSLRWDTQRWHLGDADSAGHEPSQGHLTIAMDLGMWMLLRFVPDDPSLWRRAVWLPVQRRGHETAWHALRCTVYCARPVSLPTAAPF